MRAAVLLCLGLALPSCSRPAKAKPAEAPAAPTEAVPVHLTSQPPGARVEVDGQRLSGVTPVDVPFQFGQSRLLRVTLEHFEPWEETVIAAGEKKVQVLLKALVVVHVDSQPPGARVSRDASVLLAATPGEFEAPAGALSLRVEKEGCVPALVSREVSGARAEVAVTLAPAAYLKVSSQPGGAKVFVDGQDTGLVTPLERLAVKAGVAHVVELKTEALNSGPLKVKKLAPGSLAPVSATLEDPTVRQRRESNAKLEARIARLEREKQLQAAIADQAFLKAPKREWAARQRIEQIDEELSQLEAKLQPEQE